LKSLRLSIISGVVVAVFLAAVLLIVDYSSRARIERMAQSTLNEISLPLLEQGNPTLLFGQLDEGVDLTSPRMSFITQFLPLIVLDVWEGSMEVPSFYAEGVPHAQLAARAHYSRGIADVHATLVYRNGEWLIREYEVIQGPAAQ
jgi:hypothetical protein